MTPLQLTLIFVWVVICMAIWVERNRRAIDRIRDETPDTHVRQRGTTLCTSNQIDKEVVMNGNY